jgi:hypothetical protein
MGADGLKTLRHGGERVIVTITDGDKVLVEQAVAWIRETSRNGMRGWTGHIELPQGSFVLPGGPYLLQTTDGRSGHINVRGMRSGSHRNTLVDFKGTGPFGRS